MKRLWIVSLFIVAATIFGACFLATRNPMIYVDIPSFVMAIVLPLILMLSHYTPGEMGKAFAAASAKKENSGEELNTALNFFENFQKLVIIAGVLATIMGLIAILANLGNYEQMGKNLGVALLTTLYAIIFAFVVTQPFKSAIKKKLAGK